MRPALTVIVDGRPVRLLADLEHKPWAAEDGEPWMAEFPFEFEGAEIQEVELTVAPDITVVLPLGGAGKGNRPPDGRARRTAMAGPAARSPITSAPSVRGKRLLSGSVAAQRSF